MPLRAVHFGAGNIGRGFLGQLYWESGFETCFVDVAVDVVAALHTRGEYPLRLVGETVQDLRITGVDAVSGLDTDKVAELVAHADVVSTAVGAAVLPRLAKVFAQGIEKRFSDADAAPLNIIVCENLVDGEKILRQAVLDVLSPTLHDVLEVKVGFVMASIGRMVPVMTEAQRAEDPLLVYAEPFCALPVDADAIRGAVPPIEHLQAKPNFDGYVARKIYVHNLSHAATAYLGYLRGYEYIWQAIADAEVRDKVAACMGESVAALHKAYGQDLPELEAHIEDLLQRYTNKALGDTVSRVARDPIRKLSHTDRIIGAGRLCIEHGVPPEAIAFTAAAAMRYDPADDPAAAEVQQIKSEGGISAVLEKVCGISAASALGEAILRADVEVQAFIKG